jgi:hypothetical protein
VHGPLRQVAQGNGVAHGAGRLSVGRSRGAGAGTARSGASVWTPAPGDGSGHNARGKAVVARRPYQWRGRARSGCDEVLHGGHGEGEDETGKLALGAGGSGPYQ